MAAASGVSRIHLPLLGFASTAWSETCGCSFSQIKIKAPCFERGNSVFAPVARCRLGHANA